MSTTIKNIIGIVAILAMGAVAFVGNEVLRDLIVNLVTLLFVGVAFSFQRKVLQGDSMGWQPFSFAFMGFTLFIVLMRFWDLIAGWAKNAELSTMNSEHFVFYAKYGERVAYLVAGYFVYRSVIELYSKILAEVEGE